MNALRLDNIALSIDGRELFPPLSLVVEPGTVTAVTGASGAGKSSMLKFLCGILPAGVSGTGRVYVGGDDLSQLAAQQRGLGLLFQDPLLFPHLDVAGNLLFGMRTGATRSERRERVADALRSVGLEGFSDRDPATLSGGQQARVALMRVLLSAPRALLLDEPFRSLDDDNRARVRELVFAEARRRSLPTLLVTHDQEDIVAAGGAVVRLQDSV
mgnify:FL=1